MVQDFAEMLSRMYLRWADKHEVKDHTLPALERHFGRPPASRGSSGFPQLRLLALLETGTHAIFAAVIAGFAVGEVTLAGQIVAHLKPGMLCLADRAFVGYTLWRDAAATGADLLWRARHIAVFPCLQRLDDGSFLSRLYPSANHRQHRQRQVERMQASALELAALYHERWEDEITLAELKVTIPGNRPILRSRRPDLIRQEVYGLLLTHFAIRQLMYEASQRVGRDPETLSFIQTIEIVRRNLPFHAAFPP